MYHVVDEGNGCRSFQRNPNRKVITKLDWSCVATSVEDFAKGIQWALSRQTEENMLLNEYWSIMTKVLLNRQRYTCPVVLSQ